MFDLSRSLKLITGALFSPDETWRGYQPEAGNWQKTALLITGPVIVVTAVLGYILGLLGDGGMFGMRPTLLNTVFGIVFGIIWAGVAAFIFSTLAGAFSGKTSFAAALAATSLAFVPGYFGQALGRLPWIGWLLGLGLFIYALVLLWRILPMYLDVPDSKRTGHYIASLIACIVVALVLGFLLRPIIGPVDTGMGHRPDFGSSAGTAGGATGLFGGAMRQAELIATAEDDRYSPPSDGKLDEDQVEEFIRVMNRAREMMIDQTERLREISERANKDEQVSFSDLSEVMSGATQMAGMNTVELEVVKSGNGNWAEHTWVKESLRTAWIQKDINDAVAHNYALYEEYEDDLKQYVAR
ncbi:MAG: Yip1 family protein [Woeseia sp.]